MNIPPYYSSKELTDACEFAGKQVHCFKDLARRHPEVLMWRTMQGLWEIYQNVTDDAIADAQNREDAETRQAQDEEENPEGMTRFDPHCGAGSAR